MTVLLSFHSWDRYMLLYTTFCKILFPTLQSFFTLQVTPWRNISIILLVHLFRFFPLPFWPNRFYSWYMKKSRSFKRKLSSVILMLVSENFSSFNWLSSDYLRISFKLARLTQHPVRHHSCQLYSGLSWVTALPYKSCTWNSSSTLELLPSVEKCFSVHLQ